MCIILIISIFSFLLESIISNFIPLDSQFFIPLFSLMSLVLIYPYFNGKKNEYLKTCITIGFLYDVAFTDTLILNLVLFLLIGFFICTINQIFSTNIVSVIILSIVVIIFYRILGYGILCLSGLLEFHINRLGTSISSSLLLNILYVILCYFITNAIAKKYRIRKID